MNSGETRSPGAENPVLEQPPITEVVCGFVFDPIELDGLLLGVYWDRRRATFPTKALQPAISDRFEITLETPAVRAVLTSKDSSRLIQIQRDRLYVNWRAVGSEYPRFSDHGERRGLLTNALDEFASLADFCTERLGITPNVNRVELVKVDKLERSKDHWTTIDDLAKLLPLSGTFSSIQAGKREFSVRFSEHETPNILNVAVNSVPEATGGDIAAVRIECRVAHTLRPNEKLHDAFVDANGIVNRAFFALVAQSELNRFRLRSGGSHASG